MEHSISRSKTIGWFVAGGVTAMLLVSSFAMITAALGMMPQAMHAFNEWGLSKYVLVIAVIKLVAAILFITPRTSLIGLILLSSYMGGAIVTGMQHKENYIFATITLALIWIAGFFRNPEFFKTLFSSKP